MSELPSIEKQRMIEALMSQPPKIGLVGVSGVGKSSTINRLFKTSLPTSDTVACTKKFRDISLEINATQGELSGSVLQLIVCDAPGLGEDVKKDSEYLDMYRRELPSCDVILWVTTARNRAIALDQIYLEKLQEFQDRIVFGINQVDLVEPLNWPNKLPIPSPEQEKNIKAIAEDRKTRFSDFLGRDVKVVPYSTVRGFNLEDLFTSLLESAPEGRKWPFGLIKNFKFEDWMPNNTAQDSSHSNRSGGVLDMMQRLVSRPASNMRSLSDSDLSAIENQAFEERRKRHRV